jgi:hypothetical protein
LTVSNLGFAEACGNILTNYCWKDADALKSVQLGLYSKFLAKGNIYFGVDVWAQNKSSFTHPRVTYPEYGGGGTNTGVAVAKMAEMGLSVGVFAPAWSFEHFPGHERDVEHAVWEGSSLPEKIDCICGDCASRHPSNKELAILRTAKERVAGSEQFFYTNFSRAFSTHGDNAIDSFDGSDIHPQLSEQSVLPRPTSLGTGEGAVTLSHHVENDLNGQFLVIDVTRNWLTDEETIEEWLPLYKLDMPANGSLQLSVLISEHTKSRILETKDAIVSIYWKTREAIHYLPLPLARDPSEMVNQVPKARIQELGVHLKGPWSSPIGELVRLICIEEVCITPRSNLLLKQSFKITHVRLENRNDGKREHVRLCWNYEDAAIPKWKIKGMPWSDITGPFACFVVCAPGLRFARAYALEHILDRKFAERHVGEEIEIEVMGIGFDGSMLAKKKANLQL